MGQHQSPVRAGARVPSGHVYESAGPFRAGSIGSTESHRIPQRAMSRRSVSGRAGAERSDEADNTAESSMSMTRTRESLDRELLMLSRIHREGEGWERCGSRGAEGAEGKKKIARERTAEA